MLDILDYLKREWAAISQAPFAFILLVILAFLSANTIMDWKDQAIIEALEKTLETRDERLKLESEKSYKLENDLREKSMALIDKTRELDVYKAWDTKVRTRVDNTKL